MSLTSPKSSHQNFEIVILFSIVEKSNGYAFWSNMIPNSLGEGVASLNYRKFPELSIYRKRTHSTGGGIIFWIVVFI
jgi:hypothetical protein